MDPLDREKPWSRFAQVAVITIAIGLVYLVFRWAVVVPDWGWQLILGSTAVAVALYFYLMMEPGPARAREAQSRRDPLRPVLAFLVVAALTLPAWVVLFLLLTGRKLP